MNFKLAVTVPNAILHFITFQVSYRNGQTPQPDVPGPLSNCNNGNLLRAVCSCNGTHITFLHF